MDVSGVEAPAAAAAAAEPSRHAATLHGRLVATRALVDEFGSDDGQVSQAAVAFACTYVYNAAAHGVAVLYPSLGSINSPHQSGQLVLAARANGAPLEYPLDSAAHHSPHRVVLMPLEYHSTTGGRRDAIGRWALASHYPSDRKKASLADPAVRVYLQDISSTDTEAAKTALEALDGAGRLSRHGVFTARTGAAAVTWLSGPYRVSGASKGHGHYVPSGYHTLATIGAIVERAHAGLYEAPFNADLQHIDAEWCKSVRVRMLAASTRLLRALEELQAADSETQPLPGLSMLTDLAPLFAVDDDDSGSATAVSTEAAAYIAERTLGSGAAALAVKGVAMRRTPSGHYYVDLEHPKLRYDFTRRAGNTDRNRTLIHAAQDLPVEKQLAFAESITPLASFLLAVSLLQRMRTARVPPRGLALHAVYGRGDTSLASTSEDAQGPHVLERLARDVQNLVLRDVVAWADAAVYVRPEIRATDLETGAKKRMTYGRLFSWNLPTRYPGDKLSASAGRIVKTVVRVPLRMLLAASGQGPTGIYEIRCESAQPQFIPNETISMWAAADDQASGTKKKGRVTAKALAAAAKARAAKERAAATRARAVVAKLLGWHDVSPEDLTLRKPGEEYEFTGHVAECQIWSFEGSAVDEYMDERASGAPGDAQARYVASVDAEEMLSDERSAWVAAYTRLRPVWHGKRRPVAVSETPHKVEADIDQYQYAEGLGDPPLPGTLEAEPADYVAWLAGRVPAAMDATPVLAPTAAAAQPDMDVGAELDDSEDNVLIGARRPGPKARDPDAARQKHASDAAASGARSRQKTVTARRSELRRREILPVLLRCSSMSELEPYAYEPASVHALAELQVAVVRTSTHGTDARGVLRATLEPSLRWREYTSFVMRRRVLQLLVPRSDTRDSDEALSRAATTTLSLFVRDRSGGGTGLPGRAVQPRPVVGETGGAPDAPVPTHPNTIDGYVADLFTRAGADSGVAEYSAVFHAAQFLGV